jgi:hypothetical protein
VVVLVLVVGSDSGTITVQDENEAPIDNATSERAKFRFRRYVVFMVNHSVAPAANPP